MADNVTFEGLLISQRADPADSSDGELFVFAAPARDILDWARVHRTIEATGAAQRGLSPTHHKRIRSFVEASEKNVVPTAVTLALPPGTYTVSGESTERVRRGELTVLREDEAQPAVIIDGQHRLHGLDGLDVPVLVTVLLNADRLERALQFVVINNSARKVPTDLVKGILAELNEGEQEVFESRLSRSGLTLGHFHNALRYIDQWDESPFKDLLDWDINRDGERIVKPAAIEKSLRVILARLETRDSMELDQAVELFVALWAGIKDAWNGTPEEWKESRILEKAGLVSCVEFVVERLNQEAEEGKRIEESEVVTDVARQIFQPVPHEFWLAEWDQKGLDTDAGRQLIRKAISEVRRAVALGAPEPLREVRSLNFRNNEASSN